MKHVLIPRVMGLWTILNELQEHVDFVLDFTLGYSQVGSTQFSQDIHTLPRIFFEGKGPKYVYIDCKAHSIRDIPLDSKESFQNWLNQIYFQKEIQLKSFYETQEFPNSRLILDSYPNWKDWYHVLLSIGMCLIVASLIVRFCLNL